MILSDLAMKAYGDKLTSSTETGAESSGTASYRLSSIHGPGGGEAAAEGIGTAGGDDA